MTKNPPQQNPQNNQSGNQKSTPPAPQTKMAAQNSTQAELEQIRLKLATAEAKLTETEARLAATESALQQTQQKLQDMVQVSQHALADLQNFKRRAEEEKSSFIQYANTDLILNLLPFIENVSRALEHEPKDAEWAKGVEQILKQLGQILEKRNLKVVPTVNTKFDPNMHEALMMGPGEKDIVIQELEKGYMLADRVIKRARVKVGNGANADTTT